MPGAKAGRPRVALLVDGLLAGLVTLVLRHIRAECRTVSSQAQLRSLTTEWSPHILLADLDTHERAPEWAVRDGATFPCIGLMRTREALAKLAAFDRGAFDIIEVPFTPDEIVVRTIASLKRAYGGQVPLVPRVQVGSFEMDLASSGVRMGQAALRLTPLEQTLLYVFLAHPGEVLAREAILVNIWGSSSAVTSNVIDRHIRDLRVKLEDEWRRPRFIETVPRYGYRFLQDGPVARS